MTIPTRAVLLTAILTSGSCALLSAQDWTQKLEKYRIKASVGIQLWTTYSVGQEIYDPDQEVYQKVDDRWNVQIRRTRLGLKAQPYQNLKFSVTAALDLVGRDVLSSTQAGANNGASPQFRLWEAYTQWRILSNKEHLHLVAGYIPPQIGRESITSALRSSSMEKAWTQNYLRRHLTGIAPGRAPGILVGGLFAGDNHFAGWRYDIGVFTPVFESYDGNSTGVHGAPLYTGRLALFLGDPESTDYTIHHQINYFGHRKGLTLAIAGATQGETDLFMSNNAFGIDVLFNQGNLNIDGDWTVMTRKGMQAADERTEFIVRSSAGYIRIGYNVALKYGYILEPLIMYARFEGATDAEGQHHAAQVNAPSGIDETVDLGVNLYFNQDLRLTVHYTLQNGDPGTAGDGAEVNNYFTQTGVGAIRRGDWLGLGLVAMF